MTPDQAALSEQQTALLNSAIFNCTKLQEALLQEDPNMPLYCKQINEDIRQHPELLHLLSEEQIAAIYQSVMKIATTKVEVSKSRGGKAGAKAKLTGKLDDGTDVLSLL